MVNILRTLFFIVRHKFNTLLDAILNSFAKGAVHNVDVSEFDTKSDSDISDHLNFLYFYLITKRPNLILELVSIALLLRLISLSFNSWSFASLKLEQLLSNIITSLTPSLLR